MHFAGSALLVLASTCSLIYPGQLIQFQLRASGDGFGDSLIENSKAGSIGGQVTDIGPPVDTIFAFCVTSGSTK